MITPVPLPDFSRRDTDFTNANQAPAVDELDMFLYNSDITLLKAFSYASS